MTAANKDYTGTVHEYKSFDIPRYAFSLSVDPIAQQLPKAPLSQYYGRSVFSKTFKDYPNVPEAHFLTPMIQNKDSQHVCCFERSFEQHISLEDHDRWNQKLEDSNP
jgi:hypothetical protein